MTRGGVSDFNPAALMERRTARGWTRPSLAIRARVSVATVLSWEMGRRLPTITLLARVATALGCRVADLRARRGPVTLRELRLLTGLTAKELAAKAHVSEQTLSRVESGAGRLSDRMAHRLAEVYGVPPFEVERRFNAQHSILSG